MGAFKVSLFVRQRPQKDEAWPKFGWEVERAAEEFDLRPWNRALKACQVQPGEVTQAIRSSS